MRTLWLAVLLSVSFLGGASLLEAQNQVSTPSGILQQNLRDSLQRASELSGKLERRIESLLLQIQSLEKLSTEQQGTISNLQNEIDGLQELSTRQKEILNWQSEKLLSSQNSLIASSASWTIYSQEVESMIVRLQASTRRNRLVWQIGIPSSFLAGVIVGVML